MVIVVVASGSGNCGSVTEFASTTAAAHGNLIRYAWDILFFVDKIRTVEPFY